MARVRDEAVRTIVLADNALRTSLAAVSASQALVSAGQTTFDAALAGYRNGVVSITDAILAETQLLQAKNASSDAYSTALRPRRPWRFRPGRWARRRDPTDRIAALRAGGDSRDRGRRVSRRYLIFRYYLNNLLQKEKTSIG